MTGIALDVDDVLAACGDDLAAADPTEGAHGRRGDRALRLERWNGRAAPSLRNPADYRHPRRDSPEELAAPGSDGLAVARGRAVSWLSFVSTTHVRFTVLLLLQRVSGARDGCQWDLGRRWDLCRMDVGPGQSYPRAQEVQEASFLSRSAEEQLIVEPERPLTIATPVDAGGGARGRRECRARLRSREDGDAPGSPRNRGERGIRSSRWGRGHADPASRSWNFMSC